jgi:UDP-N-acetylglucosamine 2-epimerase (non-hydrolysing)
MPEEINRTLIDHLAERLYAPTSHQVRLLRSEGIPAARMLETGNTILDAVTEHRAMAEESDPPVLPQGKFALMTLHRPALVDNPVLLRSLLERLSVASSALGITVLFLAHPRTQRTLERIGRSFPSIVVHEPRPYFAMLRTLTAAAVILTDSGGLQEEAAILHVPCITLRLTTERPETIDAGGNTLVSPFDGDLMPALRQFLLHPVSWKPLYVHTSPSDDILADLCARIP